MKLAHTIVAMSGLVALNACAGITEPGAPFWADQVAQTPAPDTATAPDPEANAQSGSGVEEDAVEPGGDLVYLRSRQGIATASSSDGLDGRTLSLDFVNAPVAAAVRAIVGDALGEPVLVASDVSGEITLTAPEPTSARAALSALDTVLSESGLALVEREDGFLLTRIEAARPTFGSSGLGMGGRVVPVRHTDPTQLLSVLDPFLTDRAQAIPLDESGVLILAGPRSELENLEDAIRTFDRPFLTDRVYGMFELRYVNAETAQREIAAVLDGLGAPSGAVRLVPLPRLNLLFVATRDRQRFDEVGDWVQRFDRPAGGDTRRLRYYVARNTPATTLASQISAAFAGSASGDGGSFGGESEQNRGSDDASNEDEGRLAIIADQLNNALIIRATDQEYREILELVERMDVLPPQVLIEATIAEVRLTDGLNFGVRWFFQSRDGEGDSAITFSDSTTGSTAEVFPGFNYAFTGSNLNATLSALNSITDVTVLSAPSIMVQNNQTAHLQVGDEVPIVTQTATSVSEANAPIVSNIELRETGVILQVTPRINASGIVVLEVNQEVSSVRPTTTSGIDSPTIQKLEFTSTVAVQSESTVALGGLIRESQTDTNNAVPFLGRVPGLGAAFRDRAMTQERSELVIFLTPRIINSTQDAESALSRMRRELQALEARQDDLFEQ
ncbi:type II secretion system secretin GspD [Maricaulaceae bacterium EIL42A08]|nr:type II secretion system secretin GspD [Maricaulaceae bacterium EIL42A08]